MVPARLPMCSASGNMTWLMLGFPIRKSPDQSLLTASRGLSQSSTSFIGNIRLGIHLVPLSTFLCIDLTSSCYFAITCYRQLKTQFLLFKLLMIMPQIWVHNWLIKKIDTSIYTRWLFTALAHFAVYCQRFIILNIRVTSNQLYSSRSCFARVFSKFFCLFWLAAKICANCLGYVGKTILSQ